MKNKDLNSSNFPYWDWDTLQFDAWEMLEDPIVLTEEEHQFGLAFVESMRLDLEYEGLVEFRAAPKHLYYLATNAFKKMKHKNP